MQENKELTQEPYLLIRREGNDAVDTAYGSFSEVSLTLTSKLPKLPKQITKNND